MFNFLFYQYRNSNQLIVIVTHVNKISEVMVYLPREIVCPIKYVIVLCPINSDRILHAQPSVLFTERLECYD